VKLQKHHFQRKLKPLTNASSRKNINTKITRKSKTSCAEVEEAHHSALFLRLGH
jgi:hypothetical protein